MIRSLSRQIAALALLTASAAHAQPAGVGGPGSVLTRMDATVSYTGAGEVERKAGTGEAATTLSSASAAVYYQASENLSLGTGAFWQGLWIDHNGSAPLPDHTHGLGLRLSGMWKPADAWSIRLDVRPGIYSDWQDIDGSDINFPALVAVGYQVNTNLLLVAGININPWSRLATIGGPGVWWRFAEDWTLNLVLPKPTLEYSLTRNWITFIGGEITGGAFRVADDFGNEYGRSNLNGEKFAYRELRASGGLRYRMGPFWGASLEAGYAFNRQFEFREADWQFRTDPAPFVRLGLQGAF